MTARRPRIVLVTDPSFGDAVLVRRAGAVARALPAGWLCVQLRDKGRPIVSLRTIAWELRRVTRDAGAMFVVNGDARLARDVGADGIHLESRCLSADPFAIPSRSCLVGVVAVREYGSSPRRRARSVSAEMHRLSWVGGWGGGGAGESALDEARRACGAGAWISVAVHSDDEARAAVDQGADALLVSPIYATRPPALGAPAKTGRGLGALRTARAFARGRAAIYALGGVAADNAGPCVDAGADGVAVVRALLGCSEPVRAARALHDVLAARC